MERGGWAQGGHPRLLQPIQSTWANNGGSEDLPDGCCPGGIHKLRTGRVYLGMRCGSPVGKCWGIPRRVWAESSETPDNSFVARRNLAIPQHRLVEPRLEVMVQVGPFHVANVVGLVELGGIQCCTYV